MVEMLQGCDGVRDDDRGKDVFTSQKEELERGTCVGKFKRRR
jgi:hypothetical protein